MTRRAIIHTSILCGLFFVGFFGVALTYGEGTEPIESAMVARDTTSTLLFVGDIMLSRDVDRQIKKHNDFTFPFWNIASTTRDADFVFGNLEGPVSDKGENQGSIYSFRDDPKTIEGLRFAGFDALSLANNHIFDWGRIALTDTVSRLNGVDIKTVGAGKNEAEANAPLIVNVKDTKIALLAFTNLYPESFWAKSDTAGISRFAENEIAEKIKELRKVADVVVVSMHWGEEYETRANAEQQRLGRVFIDAGTDIVVGHHPHVVQELEHYKNGWIAYSLGNFIFDQNFSDETRTGAMLEVKLKNKHIESVRERIITIN
ncbi:MAG: CapA family protein, partial [Patescibacteria group bacterium]